MSCSSCTGRALISLSVTVATVLVSPTSTTGLCAVTTTSSVVIDSSSSMASIFVVLLTDTWTPFVVIRAVPEQPDLHIVPPGRNIQDGIIPVQIRCRTKIRPLKNDICGRKRILVLIQHPPGEFSRRAGDCRDDPDAEQKARKQRRDVRTSTVFVRLFIMLPIAVGPITVYCTLSGAGAGGVTP